MKNKLAGFNWLWVVVSLAALVCGLTGCAGGPSSGVADRLEVNLLGKVAEFDLDSHGKLTSAAQWSSDDGKISLSLPSGASVLDDNDRPLSNITAGVDSGAPMPPPNIMFIGSIFDLAPEDVRFSPAAQLTLSYNPEELAPILKAMPLLSEDSLYLAYYRDGNWFETSAKFLDKTGHKVTGSLDRGTKFAVVMPMPDMSNCPMHAAVMAGQTPSTIEVSPPSAGQPAPNAVKVVIAGYITHGPMQSTVQAIKDVLAKYGNKVDATWVDLNTDEGAAYFKANNLSAHMNVIINGKDTYKVNGKDVTFQWFEGQQWTKQDLDTVLASLVNK